ncbi:Predicted arabinose efflux permease, MFS family [Raineyella antarctica]|uniref:Predicted arabinose efflux permease, MFS family n=1 Tax=Raineyella antarctica TaxID=1577474 RepID=A0A1G6GD98_9ACTN|nr:MFS transporter [Raineyella antarctica]SDB79944.1 Predicted arabinose efflux permease, MFS family [Raineyella antarctica]
MIRPLLSRRGAAADRLPTAVHVLGVIAFFVAVGFGVVVPVLPVFTRSFGVGQFETGMVVSSFALMRLVTSPFTGRLIDRLGERTVLVAGVLIVALSSAAMGLAQTYEQLLVFRAAGGIGSSMFTVSAMTLLIRSTAPNQRGRATGTFQTGFLVGNMAGPAVGGLLAAVSIRAPFFFYALTLVGAALVGVFLLQGHGRTTGAADAGAGQGTELLAPRPFRTVLADLRYQAALVCNFANGWSSLGIRSSLMPVLVVEVLHHTPVWTGIALAIAAVVQTVAIQPAGRFVDRVGRRPAMVAGSLIGAVAMVGIAFAPTIWLLVAALCVNAVGVALMGTAPAATVGDVAGARSGTPVAVFSMAGDAGQIIGPLAAGAIADGLDLSGAFLTGTLLMALAALASVRMPRPDRDGDQPVEVAR